MSGINNNEISPYPDKLEIYQKENDKIIDIKISKFTLKLTNWRKVDSKDFGAFFTFTVVWIFILWTAAFIPTTLVLLYYYPPSGILILLYYTRIFFFDQTIEDKILQSKEERYPAFYRQVRLASEYFPVRLIKTADLPANKNYILACYPHAVLTLHVVPNFTTNFNNRDTLFPGISIRAACHSLLLYVPFTREALMNIVNGCCCAASSLKQILNSKPSRAVLINIGGASEVSLSGKGDNTYRIIKSRRKGFIRIALETGASLVPVFTFGEIHTYKGFPLRGSRKPTLGIDLFMTRGRGYFQHNFGFLPHRVPINTVVGEPIPVPKVVNPSSELIDEYHEKYFNALQSLFDEHKQKYDIAGEKAKLIMF